MWSYYGLTIAQDQTDRRATAGYTVSPVAVLEFPEDVIARSLAEISEADRLREQAARQTAIAALCSTIITFFHRTAAVAEQGPRESTAS